MTTRREFDKVMDDLLTAYPERGRDVDADGWSHVCSVYFDVLHDIPLELLQTAARECIASLKWFPKPSEIREEALQLVMIGLGIPTANDAWAEVQLRMRNALRVRRQDGDSIQVEVTGMYDEAPGGYLIRRDPRAEDWSSPIIQKAIDGIGGWRALRTSDNEIADRSQFLRAYERYSMRQMQIARMLPETKQAVLDWRSRGGAIPGALMPGTQKEALP